MDDHESQALMDLGCKIDPSLHPVIRPISDIDIAFIRANLKCHILSQSSKSSPRQWLSTTENQQLFDQINHFWTGIDDHYKEMSKIAVEDRGPVSDFRYSSFLNFTEQLKSLKTERFFGFIDIHQKDANGFNEIPVFDPLPYSNNDEDTEKSSVLKNRDVKRCLVRDLERSWQEISRLPNIAYMSDERKIAITEGLNKDFERLNKNNIGDEKSIGSIYSKSVKQLKSSLNDAFEKLVSHKDVDRRRLALSERFGFDGVTISNSFFSTSREQVRWLDSAEKNLEKACRRLGIKESSFGMQSRCSFEIDSPETAWNKKADGTFGVFSQDNTRINYSSSAVDGACVLVHEYTHQLDNLLALKALQASNTLSSTEEKTQFFSELSNAQKSTLPLAKKGLDQIFQQILDHTPKNKIDTSNDFINKKADEKPNGYEKIISWFSQRKEGEKKITDNATGLEKLDRHAVHSNLSHDEFSRNSPNSLEIIKLLEKAVDRFSVVHLGSESFLKMSKQDHEQYKESLMKNGAVAILEMAKGWTRLPMEDIFACMDVHGAGAHMDIAKKIHGAWEMDRRQSAVSAIEPMLVSLNARINFDIEPAILPTSLISPIFPISPIQFSTLATLENFATSAPGVMVQESVRRDRERIDMGHQSDYYSQRTELLARVLSRPHGIEDIFMRVGAPHEIVSMSHGQLGKLSNGLEKMMDCAGVPRTNCPSLSSRLEPEKFLIAKISKALTHDILKLAPRINAMFYKKPENSYPSIKIRKSL